MGKTENLKEKLKAAENYIKELEESIKETNLKRQKIEDERNINEGLMRSLCENILSGDINEISDKNSSSWSRAGIPELIERTCAVIDLKNQNDRIISNDIHDENENLDRQAEKYKAKIDCVYEYNRKYRENKKKPAEIWIMFNHVQDFHKDNDIKDTVIKTTKNKNFSQYDKNIARIEMEHFDSPSPEEAQLIKEAARQKHSCHEVSRLNKNIESEHKKKLGENYAPRKKPETDLKNYESIFQGGELDVIRIMGDTGASEFKTILEIKNRDYPKIAFAKTKTKNIAERLLYCGNLDPCLSKETIHTPFTGKTMVYSLTDAGKDIYTRITGNAPKKAMCETLKEKYGNLETGYRILKTTETLEKTKRYISVEYKDENKHPIKSAAGEFLAGIVCTDRTGRETFFEYLTDISVEKAKKILTKYNEAEEPLSIITDDVDSAEQLKDIITALIEEYKTDADKRIKIRIRISTAADCRGKDLSADSGYRHCISPANPTERRAV